MSGLRDNARSLRTNFGDAVAGDEPDALGVAGGDEQRAAHQLGEEHMDLGRHRIEQMGDPDGA